MALYSATGLSLQHAYLSSYRNHICIMSACHVYFESRCLCSMKLIPTQCRSYLVFTSVHLSKSSFRQFVLWKGAPHCLLVCPYSNKHRGGKCLRRKKSDYWFVACITYSNRVATVHRNVSLVTCVTWFLSPNGKTHICITKKLIWGL